MFLEPKGRSKEEVEEDVNNGRFPPCILYQIIYTNPEEKRVKFAMMKVTLHGADVPLSFNCRVKEKLCECVCSQFMCCGLVGALYCVCKSTATCILYKCPFSVLYT